MSSQRAPLKRAPAPDARSPRGRPHAADPRRCSRPSRRSSGASRRSRSGVELPKSTTHRLLETLMAQRFVELGTRHGTYRLGLRAAVVGNTAMQSRRPSEDVHAMLCAAAAEISDGVGLSVLEGTDAVIIDRADVAAPAAVEPVRRREPARRTRRRPARCCSPASSDEQIRGSTPVSTNSRARPPQVVRSTSCCCTSGESAATASPSTTRSSRRACGASRCRCSTRPAG